MRVCADGGANRLYDELPGLVAAAATAGPSGAEEVRATYLPSAIRGDLDSIRADVLHFYRQRGVQVSDLSGACKLQAVCTQGPVPGAVVAAETRRCHAL